MRRDPPQDGGFSLLEVLVALLITGIAFGALFQGALGGLRAADISGRTEEALSRARSRIAVLGQAAPITAGDRQGEDGGGYRWQERVAPVSQRAAAPGSVGIALYRIEVRMSWGEGSAARSVTLETKRLGSTPPAPP